eukprot:TRINITY_DN30022_c0_g1_i1.p1 TRINITY_DN30022_c0_g1~~TRINITY_DN30022_c0_g1_i1.p1  ORF type:complete len:1222 (+),score=154.78 TRINITY_DN30022_c0_g1_i1:212-3667(+)
MLSASRESCCRRCHDQAGCEAWRLLVPLSTGPAVGPCALLRWEGSLGKPLDTVHSVPLLKSGLHGLGGSVVGVLPWRLPGPQALAAEVAATAQAGVQLWNTLKRGVACVDPTWSFTGSAVAEVIGWDVTLPEGQRRTQSLEAVLVRPVRQHRLGTFIVVVQHQLRLAAPLGGGTVAVTCSPDNTNATQCRGDRFTIKPGDMVVWRVNENGRQGNFAKSAPSFAGECERQVWQCAPTLNCNHRMDDDGWFGLCEFRAFTVCPPRGVSLRPRLAQLSKGQATRLGMQEPSALLVPAVGALAASEEERRDRSRWPQSLTPKVLVLAAEFQISEVGDAYEWAIQMTELLKDISSVADARLAKPVEVKNPWTQPPPWTVLVRMTRGTSRASLEGLAVPWRRMLQSLGVQPAFGVALRQDFPRSATDEKYRKELAKVIEFLRYVAPCRPHTVLLPDLGPDRMNTTRLLQQDAFLSGLSEDMVVTAVLRDLPTGQPPRGPISRKPRFQGKRVPVDFCNRPPAEMRHSPATALYLRPPAHGAVGAALEALAACEEQPAPMFPSFRWAMVVVPMFMALKFIEHPRGASLLLAQVLVRPSGEGFSPWKFRSSDDVARLSAISGEPWDLRTAPSAGSAASGALDSSLRFSELMTLRHELPMLVEDGGERVPALHYIEDKILLKTITAGRIPGVSWVPLLRPPSRDLADAKRMWPFLTSIQYPYVVKPSHLCRSRYVEYFLGTRRAAAPDIMYTKLKFAWKEEQRPQPVDTREAFTMRPGFLVEKMVRAETASRTNLMEFKISKAGQLVWTKPGPDCHDPLLCASVTSMYIFSFGRYVTQRTAIRVTADGVAGDGSEAWGIDILDMDGDILLRWRAYPAAKFLLRTARIGGVWTREEKHGGWPYHLESQKSIQVELRYGLNSWEFLVDGARYPQLDFSHVSHSMASSAMVTGNLINSRVELVKECTWVAPVSCPSKGFYFEEKHYPECKLDPVFGAWCSQTEIYDGQWSRCICSPVGLTSPESHIIVEVKSTVVWGEVLVMEWVLSELPMAFGSLLFTKNGTNGHFTRTATSWQGGVKEAFGLSSLDFPLPRQLYDKCFERIVDIAERVGNQGHFDFIRVDVLIEGFCRDVYVSELSFFPSQKSNEEAMVHIEQRWKYGYGLA